MSGIKDKVAIIGMGCTRFGERFDASREDLILEAVQEALDTLMQNRTTVIIAHRLSTVRNADLIVVLKDGKIAQQGSHSQLLQQGGIYRDLYTLQLRDAKGARSDLFAMGEPER